MTIEVDRETGPDGSRPMTLPITVVIPVRNEAANLPGCLAAVVDDFERTVVVDSGSSDATCQIARDAGVAVLDFQWNGGWPKKRNWTLETHSFTTPWVLFLDADEQVSAEFVAELRRVLPETSHNGFWLNYTNWFMGKRIRYGDPFRKLALFRVGTGQYERFPEEHWCALDMEVHEHPVVEGTVGEIKSPIEHRDYRGLKHYIAKHNEYSSWESERYVWLKSADADAWEQLNPRQRFKYRNLNRWWLAWLYFFVSYFVRRGFLDGSVGWTFNRMKKRYFEDIRMKIGEREAASRS